MSNNDFEDYLKNQENIKLKKIKKQERLRQKQLLIEEIKNTCLNKNTEMDSREWALQTLHSTNLCSLIDIKKKYLKLVQKYHPDRNNGEYNEKILKINEAWEIIKKITK